MEPKNLRELIIHMKAKMSTASERPATIGQLMQIASMIEKEIGNKVNITL